MKATFLPLEQVTAPTVKTDAAASEQDALDAKRLAWLCDSGNIYWITVQLEPSGDELFDDSPCRRDLRAAIDAAIAAQKGGAV